MKLDATDLRYLTGEEFKVLRAVEVGSKNHEIVPTALIANLSHLAHSGINKLIAQLAKRNLIARVQNAKYDGYRLTYGGYDWLAVRKFREEASLAKVGHRVGVGKESDIYLCQSPSDEQLILKIHRLGRISFRKIKEKRDYLGKRRSASWMYLSKLGAEKEFQFMQLLHSHDFPVPRPVSHSRHSIVMSLIDAYPLRQIISLPLNQIPILYSSLMRLIVKLARAGLIHGDFNEFNLLIRESQVDRDYQDEDLEGEERQGRDRQFQLGAGAGAEGQVQGKGEMRERIKEIKDDFQKDSELGFDLRGKAQWRRNNGLLKLDRKKEIVQNGNGFQRIVAVENQEEEEEDDEEDEEDEEDEKEDQDQDDDGVVDGVGLEEKIHFKDGTIIEPILIDFPQMVSVEHENAEYFFDRDVECVRRFFRKRFRFHSDEYPTFKEVMEARTRVLRKRKRAEEIERKRTEGADTGELQETIEKITLEDDPQNQENEEEVEGEEEEDDESLGEILELDVMAKASGWSGASKKEKEEDRFLASVLATAYKRSEDGAVDDDDEDEEDEDEEANEEESEEESQGDVQREEPPVGSDLATKSDLPERKRDANLKSNSSSSANSKPKLPSKGAALKALADGNSDLIAQRVAAERVRIENKSARHHGKKHNSAKGGRYHPGGKAKSDEVRNNLAF